jgi:hypothetical protein
MNRSLKWRGFLPKEYRHVSAGHGPNLFAWIEPANLKAECIPIVLLRAFNISNGQFRHWLANRRQGLFCVHEALLYASSVLMGARITLMRFSGEQSSCWAAPVSCAVEPVSSARPANAVTPRNSCSTTIVRVHDRSSLFA